MLQLDSTMNVLGRAMKSTWKAERLNVTHTVSGVSLTCRENSMSNPMMGGKMVMLDCPQVPGGSVRTTMKSNRMGAGSTTVTELIAYVKK